MTTRVQQLAEIGAPGAAIGVLAGATVGGMSMLVGHPLSWALVGTLTLGLPLALLGGVYGALLAAGRFKPGTFTPAGLFWLVGFPVSRLVHETVTPALLGGNYTPPSDVPTFLLFQLLISTAFAFGFLWLHERITPGWLARIREHNPTAEVLYAQYIEHAEAMWRARERKKVRLAAGRSNRPAATSGSAGGSRSRRSS